MADFDKILRESSRRIAGRQNAGLHLPNNPILPKRIYWGWITTPAASVIGILLGIYLPFFSFGNNGDSVAMATDTVRITDVRHDTLYLTQVECRETICHDTVFLQKEADDTHTLSENPVSMPKETPCSSIQCDGIDYSLLVLN